MGANENCGRSSTFKFPAAYGQRGYYDTYHNNLFDMVPSYEKNQNAIFFFNFWQIAKKVIACIAP